MTESQKQLTREYYVNSDPDVGRSSEFIIHTVYCDGFDTQHAHDRAQDAAEDYASGLALALAPPEQTAISLAANTDQVAVVPKHVRQVTMLVFDKEDNRIHHIDSGVFPCEHRPAEPA